MARDVTNLAERIKALDRETKMDAICRLMADYTISMGDLIEYYNSKGSIVKSDAARLREINQTRKNAQRLAEESRLNLQKARQAKKEKKERLVSSVPTPAPIVVEEEMI